MFTISRKTVKTAVIAWQYARMTYAKWIQYPLNFWLDVGLRFVEAGLFFLFWGVLLGNKLNVGNWTMQGFLLIYFFEVLFIWCMVCFSFAATYSWEKIVSGDIDKFLVRPTIPWAMIALEEINPNIGAFFVAAAALVAAVASGAQISLPILLVGLIMCFLAELAVIGIWFLVFQFVWRRGLKRYESYGG